MKPEPWQPETWPLKPQNQNCEARTAMLKLCSRESGSRPQELQAEPQGKNRKVKTANPKP